MAIGMGGLDPMMDDRDIGCEIERVAAGLVGLALLASVCIRLWRLSSGIFYETVWSAIAGTPLIAGRSSWDYGLREVSPSGELVAYATILIVVALILGAILDCRRCYWLAGEVVVSGYLVNACLMLRLLAAY